MIDNLRKLCEFNAPSGNEDAVREFIISEIKDFTECETDNSGNIIAFKKGKNKTDKKIMVDAHMDEVGIIISGATSDGFLKFQTVGGIMPSALFCKRVTINNSVLGVIGAKPIHLTKGDDAKKCPKTDAMYIDIGAKDKDTALSTVPLGSLGVICSDFDVIGDNILSKALDDRIGCAVLIELIKTYNDYDFYATFTVGEEIGLRGAKTAAYTVNPDYALVLEGTTASDIDGTDDAQKVCTLSAGAAISFMDNSTLYDRSLYNAALNSGVKCQPKAAVAGGNNSGAIHLSGSGVKTLAISAPCRYIHTAGSVANINDIKSMLDLTKVMLTKIGSGEI